MPQNRRPDSNFCKITYTNIWLIIFKYKLVIKLEIQISVWFMWFCDKVGFGLKPGQNIFLTKIQFLPSFLKIQNF